MSEITASVPQDRICSLITDTIGHTPLVRLDWFAAAPEVVRLERVPAGISSGAAVLDAGG